MAANLLSPCIIEQCRDYMGMLWIHNKPHIYVSIITGGLTNSLFLLKITSEGDSSSKHEDPTCCLLRIFANLWSQEEIALNNVITAILAERGIGPRIYGVLPGNQGRLEEFYISRQLRTTELIQHFDWIAVMVGKFNRQTMPLPKTDKFLLNSMHRFLEKINTLPIEIKTYTEKIERIRSLLNWDKEINWIGEYMRSIGSPILLCHNDLNESNFLLLKDGQLKLIDFEFCNYNYRGFELAQLFYECSITMTYPEYPYFKHTYEDYPNYEQRREFITKYLNAFEPGISHDEIEINSVLLEVECMKIAVDLYWALWSLVMAYIDDRFGYTEYADLRIEFYLSEKAKLNID